MGNLSPDRLDEFRWVDQRIEEKIEQALTSLEPQGLSNSQLVRIEALNIASREAVVRSYDGTKNAVQIATEMVAFIEGGAIEFRHHSPATPAETAKQAVAQMERGPR
jgi:hypothetical protein